MTTRIEQCCSYFCNHTRCGNCLVEKLPNLEDSASFAPLNSYLPHECSDDFDVANVLDTTSVISLESQVTVITSIGPTSLGGAADEFADILMRDEHVRQYFEEGFKVMESERLERNFRRLLKDYAASLRKDANDDIKRSATRLVHNYRPYITRAVKSRVTGGDEEDGRATALHDIKNQQASRLTLERLIGQYSVPADNHEPEPAMDNELESDAESQSEAGQPYLPNLEMVTEFLVSSQAFETFKKRLHDFVRPHSPPQLPVITSSFEIKPLNIDAETTKSNTANHTLMDERPSVNVAFEDEDLSMDNLCPVPPKRHHSADDLPGHEDKRQKVDTLPTEEVGTSPDIHATIPELPSFMASDSASLQPADLGSIANAGQISEDVEMTDVAQDTEHTNNLKHCFRDSGYFEGKEDDIRRREPSPATRDALEDIMEEPLCRQVDAIEETQTFEPKKLPVHIGPLYVSTSAGKSHILAQLEKSTQQFRKLGSPMPQDAPTVIGKFPELAVSKSEPGFNMARRAKFHQKKARKVKCLKNTILKQFRPPIPAGKRRVEWLCVSNSLGYNRTLLTQQY
jgi:hypothetical protein